jgi:hypothetical protein
MEDLWLSSGLRIWDRTIEKVAKKGRWCCKFLERMRQELSPHLSRSFVGTIEVVPCYKTQDGLSFIATCEVRAFTKRDLI